MTTDLLNKIAGTHLNYEDFDDDVMRTQNRFSDTRNMRRTPFEKEKIVIESEIVDSVQAYVVSSMDVPKQEPWWKKFIAF